jgi:aspartyl-tRNA(Asn)/glutamyl-tRNA(Gln) amidotransferase subunit A
VVGFKPTYRRFSTKGVLPLSWSLDHAGPIARTIEDCALALGIEVRPRHDWKSLRVGVPENFFFERVDEEVAAAVRAAIREMERMGAQVKQLRVPDPVEANGAARMIQWAEFAAQYGKIADRHLYGDDLWALREQSLLTTGHDYVNAQRVRAQLRREWNYVWREVDIIATPTTPITAPKSDAKTVHINGIEEDTRMASTRLVRAINLIGEPALSVPCGKDRNNMPIGLQLIAKPGGDELLLSVQVTNAAQT